MRSEADHILRLSEQLTEGLRSNNRLKVYSKPNPCGIISFAHKEKQSEEIASSLSENFSVAVRGGLHCAPLMHRMLGTERTGAIRASLSPHNTVREIKFFLNAIRRMTLS